MLPPYPRLVTELTTIVVNHPDNRSPASYVKGLLQLDVTDPRYARDRFGTKCNYLLHDGMHVFGYPVAWLLARQYIDWANKAGGPFTKMVIQDAIKNANLGCPTWAGLREPDTEHSHVVWVLPQEATEDPSSVLIAQAGASNFYGRPMRYGVPFNRCKEVQFFGAP